MKKMIEHTSNISTELWFYKKCYNEIFQNCESFDSLKILKLISCLHPYALSLEMTQGMWVKHGTCVRP